MAVSQNITTHPRVLLLVTLKQQITESSMRDVNLETMIDMLSWCKICQLNGFNLIRAKLKLLKKTEKRLHKFLEPKWKTKIIYTDNSLEFGKVCEDLSSTHCTSTPHRSETDGIAESVVRRIKEGTSAVLLHSGLDEKWWAGSMECFTSFCETCKISCLMGNSARMAIRRTTFTTSNSVWSDGRPPPYFCQRPVATASICSKSLARYIPRLYIIRVRESGQETFWSETLRNWKRWTHLRSMLGDWTQRKC